jgi:hypothetical protein
MNPAPPVTSIRKTRCPFFSARFPHQAGGVPDPS